MVSSSTAPAQPKSLRWPCTGCRDIEEPGVEPAGFKVPRTVTAFVVLSGIVITVLGLRELAWLVTPAALALVIVILVHPLYTGLVRRGVPAAVALVALLLSIFGIVLGLVAV